MARIKDEQGRVVQLILFTHNVHFHNEVTYESYGASTAGRKFFLVRKRAGKSSEVQQHESENPIRTVYKSLWDEVARAVDFPGESSIGLQNVMRRILENYFRILGGIKDDELIDRFENELQPIVRSLFSWVNEGSHSIIEPLYYSPTAVSTSLFLDVFENIFIKSGHGEHYKMMMRR